MAYFDHWSEQETEEFGFQFGKNILITGQNSRSQ